MGTKATGPACIGGRYHDDLNDDPEGLDDYQHEHDDPECLDDYQHEHYHDQHEHYHEHRGGCGNDYDHQSVSDR